MNGPRAAGPGPVLVCFALKDEAKYFHPSKQSCEVKVLITGMGRKNTESSVRPVLASLKPRMVITSGFAGGLDPALTLSAIIFDEDADVGLTTQLEELGAKRAKFFCADRIAATAMEKKSLRESTGAGAVEMESAVIRELCARQKIPSATVRVVSDVASEDMPLDFNQLTTADMRMDFMKLTGKLVTNPGKIPSLMRFGKQTQAAARALGNVLTELLLDRRD